MPGQCYACGSEFSFFKKERGCKNCGFAFCSNCLTKKAAVPKLENSKHHVCNKCFNVLTGKAAADQKARPHSPPEAYKKRLAALEQKEAEGHHRGSHAGAGASKPNPKYAALDKPDRDIALRLEKLKEKPQEQRTTDKDLNERLARLKGEDPAVRTAPAKPFYQPPDRRTQVEEIDDLLEEIANEVEIDSHRPDPAAYVEDRLSRLRGEEAGPDKNKENDLDKNLDKRNPASAKSFVKNIHTDGATGGSQTGEGSEVDFAEVQALMNRAAAQMEADAQRALEGMKKDKELMERLAEIKQRQKDKEEKSDGQSVESNVDNTEQDEDSEDEETAAQRIMLRYLEEAKLDEKVGDDLAESSASSRSSDSRSKTGKDKEDNRPKKSSTAADADSDYEDPDELPYCCICTEDAVVRCIDCDMDLYCNRCFREGHKDLGLEDHRSVPYKAPKGYR